MTKLVLVVEDDVAIAEATAMVIEDEGYECLIATESRNLLPIIKKVRPDLVLLDLLLPDGNGMDIAREIKKIGLKIPVVMVTARASAKSILTDGYAQAFLEKPYDVEDLLEIVNSQIK